MATTSAALSASHSTFVIERSMAAPVSRVFAAWSNAELKRQWASCHEDWRMEAHSLDFRVGGMEVSRVVEPGGTVHTMNARFLDIVADRRIVYVYDMQLDERRLSVSLVTVMFEETATRATRPSKTTTRMTFTEQVTFLDGQGDSDERKEGTEVGLDRLGRLLAPGPPAGGIIRPT